MGLCALLGCVQSGMNANHQCHAFKNREDTGANPAG